MNPLPRHAAQSALRRTLRHLHFVLLAAMFLAGLAPAMARDVAAGVAAAAPRPAGAVLDGLRQDPAMAFGHYTFAVMWLPGICTSWTDEAAVCDAARGSSATQRFTLHGLWPSRPRTLIERDIAAPVWWRQGCHLFDTPPSDTPPACSLPPLSLPAPLRERLDRDMPLARTCLDRHEYDKHVACFGPAPAPFFATALDLLDALNATPFARWVSAHAGQTVPRQAIERAFARGFGLPDASALQLQCAARPGAARKDQLEQLWFTIATDRLAAFPAALSFAPGRRGNCAAQVHIATLPD